MPTVADNYALDEYELLANVCEESYFTFFREFNDVFMDEELIYNWHLKYLCHEIQVMAERVIKQRRSQYDLIVNVPPGMTKSSIFSVAFCPWMWTRMPRFKMICVTHTDMLGKDLSTKARDIVQSDKYRRCWPHLNLREDQNTKDKWDNDFGGWRMSVTVGGRVPTGFHAHWIGIDDAIDPEKATSAQEIKNATDYCRRTLPSRKISKTTVPTAMVAQRLDVDDPTGDRLRNKEAGPVKHICLPCDDSWPIHPPALIRRYRKQKGLLDPIRLPRKVLKEQAGQSQFAYAGQYGQSPLPKGGLIFDVSQFDGKIKKSAPHDFTRIIRYWDKAYSQDSGANTAGVKLGERIVDGLPQYWVLDCVTGQWESATRERQIKLVATQDGRKVRIWVEQEPAAGKESVQNTIRNLAGFRVFADRRGGVGDANKVMRADPFATQVNAGNVYLLEGPWNHDYIEELRYFSEKAKYKDRVDASSGAFNAMVRVRKVGALK